MLASLLAGAVLALAVAAAAGDIFTSTANLAHLADVKGSLHRQIQVRPYGSKHRTTR